MTYPSWEPRYRVTTIAPGKIDLFVVTYIDGRQAALQPVTEYDDALAKARDFHRGHPRCQIKVLALSGPEARNLAGLDFGRPTTPTPADDAVRKRMIENLLSIARETSDADARADAFDLLRDMGVIQP